MSEQQVGLRTGIVPRPCYAVSGKPKIGEGRFAGYLLRTANGWIALTMDESEEVWRTSSHAHQHVADAKRELLEYCGLNEYS